MPRRVIVLVLALAAAAGGPHARARDEAEEPGRAFAPAWAGLADTSGWRMRVSAPFPQAWPPPAGGAAVVCYAYAARLRPGLADGEQVASPWARSVEAPDGVTRVTVLGTVAAPSWGAGRAPAARRGGGLGGTGAGGRRAAAGGEWPRDRRPGARRHLRVDGPQRRGCRGDRAAAPGVHALAGVRRDGSGSPGGARRRAARPDGAVTGDGRASAPPPRLPALSSAPHRVGAGTAPGRRRQARGPGGPTSTVRGSSSTAPSPCRSMA